jgi:HPt (histidine-containing phosphotransfer) domain-containing protein
LSNWICQGFDKKPVIPDKPVDTSLAADKFTHIDINRGLTITANNTQLLERLLLKFAETYQSVFSKLQILMADNDNQQIEHLAHSLKGASASIGALELQSLSAELELNAKNSNAKEISRLIKKVGKTSDNVIAEIKKVLVNRETTVISSIKENSSAVNSLLVENGTKTKHLKLLKKYILSNDTSAEHEAMRLIAANMISKDKQSLMDLLLKQIQMYDFEAAEETFMNVFDDYLGTEL